MKITPKYLSALIIAVVVCLASTCVEGKGQKQHRSRPQAERSRQAPGIMNAADAIAPTDFTGVGTVSPLADVPEQIMQRDAYIVSYNRDTRCPNWVAWRLTRQHTDGEVKRKGFYDDTTVAAPRATNADYKGSGYSRGHLCPAGDNKWSDDAMRQTFLLTNICPQNANLNSGVWNQIEISCRQWANRYGDIYIITGPMYFKSEQRRYIGENRVAVPDAFFKVVLCLNGPKAIGFVCRNTEGDKRKDMYVNTLSQVERLTGLHFFPDLDQATRALVADHASLDEW